MTAGTPYIKVGSTVKTARDTSDSDQSGYLKYTDGTHSVYLKEIGSDVCQIEDAGGSLLQKYDNLPDALSAVTGGQTIRLLKNIVYEKTVNGDSAVDISGTKEITIQMDGKNLTIRNPGTGSALEVQNGAEVYVNGTGTLSLEATFSPLFVFYGEYAGDIVISEGPLALIKDGGAK